MLLAVDAGNTDTVIGLFDTKVTDPQVADDGLIDHWRIATHAERTADEHAVMFMGFLAAKRLNWLDDIEGLVVSSGVPRVMSSLRSMSERYLGVEAIVLEPGTRTGVAIRTDNPKEVGADRIANAVAAFDLYGGPTIMVDFGTATTCDAVSADGEYLGGAIAPGVEISLDALVGRAAALRQVEIGRSPVRCWVGPRSSRSSRASSTGTPPRSTGSVPASRTSWGSAPWWARAAWPPSSPPSPRACSTSSPGSPCTASASSTP